MSASAETSAASRWDIVTVAMMVGILAGMQIGKVAPALPVLRTDLDLDLVTAGWVASLFTLAGACGGALIGASADRIGPRRAARFSLLMLAIGSLWGGFSSSLIEIMLSRSVESLGFIGTAVSCPRLIVGAVAPKDRNLALGIWGTFVPGGMTIAMLMAPIAMPAIGWRGIWILNGCLALAMIGVLAWKTRNASWTPPDAAAAPIPPLQGLMRCVSQVGPWLLALTFFAYSMQYLSVTAWMPSFLIDARGLEYETANYFAAIVVAANMIGNVLAGILLARGMTRQTVLLAAFIGMAICAAGLYGPWLETGPRIVSAFLFSAIGGLIPGALMAATPVHAPATNLVGVVNGLMMQGSNIGALTGPPLIAGIVTLSGGWHGATWHALIFCVVGSLGALLLGWRERKTARFDTHQA
ncbi:CynX/NimT family MFS transporter [Hwanghaeella grinnelliae]|nr:MFS transporter [Hwanghaeella grinnelliae]